MEMHFQEGDRFIIKMEYLSSHGVLFILFIAIAMVLYDIWSNKKSRRKKKC